MKKILAAIFILVMSLCMTVTAFAAPGSFVSSPSAIQAPELVDYSNASSSCTAIVKVVAYADRSTLSAEGKETIETAYTQIVSTKDLGTLNADLAALAKNFGVDSTTFAVSDLFDITYSGCDTHSTHSSFTITIKPGVISNFVGLIHYTNSGWELVKDVKLENGEMTFTVNSLSPFAIVVHNGSVVEPEKTSWFDILLIIIFCLIVLLIFIFLIIVILRKKREIDEKIENIDENESETNTDSENNE